nr:venom protein [Lampona murina]
MAALPLFSFLISLYVLHPAVYCESAIPKSLEIPFKARCSKKCEAPEENADDVNFPLYQCSCSSSCSIYGDCCLDSKYENAPIWHKTDFVCLSVIGHGKYRVVSGCPLDKSPEFCIDGLGHLPPVTSLTSNVTYANIFCATCNEDVKNLVTWNVELRCSSEIDDNDSPNDTIRIIFRYGDIWRLNESDGSKRLCMYRAHFNDFSFLTGLELRSCTNMKKISDLFSIMDGLRHPADV